LKFVLHKQLIMRHCTRNN